MSTHTDLDRGGDDVAPEPGGPKRQGMAHNFSVLMASQVVTWGLALAAAVMIPRYLGAEVLGRFHIASSLWAIGTILAVFGVDMLLAKEIARNPGRIGPLLAASVVTRLVLYVPVGLMLTGYGIAAGYHNQTIVLLVILGAASAMMAVSSSIKAILQGLERMDAIALGAMVGRAIYVGGALLALALGYGVYAVAAILCVGNLTNLAVHVAALQRTRRELLDHSRLTFEFSTSLSLLRRAVPYFGIAFFIGVYAQIDVIVISLVVEPEAVLGWYGAAERLGATLLFIPTIFATAGYPTLSRLYAEEGDSDRKLVRKSVEFMLLTGVPIGFGLAVISGPLVDTLYGAEFTKAGEILFLGGIVTTLNYLTIGIGICLISMDRERAWTRVIATATLLTIPLDLVLVPLFQRHFDNGGIGGMVAYVITETVLVAAAVRLLPPATLGAASLRFALKVVFAGLVMAAVVHASLDLPLVVPLALGATVYAIMVAGLRLIAPEDRALLLSRLPAISGPRGRGTR